MAQNVYNKTNDFYEVSDMLAIGCDHAGVELKNAVEEELKAQGIEYKGFGTFDSASVDYPLIAQKVACSVASGESKRGILICGTGVGMSIAANKVNGIRASLCHDTFSARMTRMHNDSNVLCMGARVIGVGLALDITNAWLHTDFEGGRHQRRVDLMTQMEQNR